MNLPDDYIKFLGFNSIPDFIENLYLKSLIETYPKVLKVQNIQNFDENHIRNEFQKILCFESGRLSDLINNRIVFLAVENQIITQKNERKRTDIEFNLSGLKYVIECKKLKGVSKTQYINKGISRFINHEYIGENEKYAGMCSFITAGDIENIIRGTKDRISEYNNINIDNRILCNLKFSFSSTHSKINNKKILIHHLFFNLKK